MHRSRSLYGACALLIGMALFIATTTVSRAAGKDLAVLVVGKSTDATMASTEKGLIEQLTKLRVQKGWGHKLLPIFSYHFDKATERAYCEERLKVKSAELLTVGIVELESGVPVSYVYRENNVSSPAAVAEKLMDHAQSELAARGQLPGTTAHVTQTATQTPVAVHPVASSSPSHPVALHTTSPTVTATTKPVQTHTSTQATAAAKRAAWLKKVAARKQAAAAAHQKALAQKKANHKPATVAKSKTTKPAAKVVVVKHPDKVVVVTHQSSSIVSGTEKWAIQVGLFSTLEKAREMAHKCKEGHKIVEIRKAKADSYRVLVGRFPSQTDAYNKAKELKGSGVEAFSVRVEPKLGKVIH
jgi:cell division septation protein DedD